MCMKSLRRGLLVINFMNQTTLMHLLQPDYNLVEFFGLFDQTNVGNLYNLWLFFKTIFYAKTKSIITIN